MQSVVKILYKPIFYKLERTLINISLLPHFFSDVRNPNKERSRVSLAWIIYVQGNWAIT